MMKLSPLTCPACRGALWELDKGEHLCYRCHIGHAYSGPSQLVEQDIAMEQGIFTALRAVQEKAADPRRIAASWPDSMDAVRKDYETCGHELDDAAELWRALLAGGRL